MKFEYTPQLLEHMKKVGKSTVLVELVEASSGDFDFTELHVYLADERTKKIFVEKKEYHVVPTDEGEVLLPNFPLTFDETVTFGLKKFLFVKYLSYTGIKI